MLCHTIDWLTSKNSLTWTFEIQHSYSAIVFFIFWFWDIWPVLRESVLGACVTLTVSICQSEVWLSSLPPPSMKEPHCCSQLDTTQGRSFCLHLSLVISSQHVCAARVNRSLSSVTCTSDKKPFKLSIVYLYSTTKVRRAVFDVASCSIIKRILRVRGLQLGYRSLVNHDNRREWWSIICLNSDLEKTFLFVKVQGKRHTHTHCAHGAKAGTHPLLPTMRVQMNHSLLSVCSLSPAVSKNDHSAAAMQP